MQSLLENARETLSRFQHAAVQKQARFGNWQTVASPDTNPFDNTLDDSADQNRSELSELETQFTQSLTDEQIKLQEQIHDAKLNMDVCGQDVYDSYKALFKASLSEDQQALQNKIDETRFEWAKLQTKSLQKHFNRESQVALTFPMPPATNKIHAEATCALLNAAINLTRFNDTKGQLMAPPIRIQSRTNDMQYILRIGKTDEMIDLNHISHRVEHDIANSLCDPSQWVRLKTNKGISYQITAELYHEPIAFDVTLLLMSEYKPHATYQLIVDDRNLMTFSELFALKYRESKEADLLGQPPPKHHCQRYLTLSGPAADEILGALGVDKLKIKDAPIRNR